MPEDSLFLEYSYTFPPFIPFIAARKRHFAVFTSSCILLLTSTVFTPMSAGIFQKRILHIPSANEVTYLSLGWQSITGGIERNSGLYYYRAYMHGWLDSPLPAFTTGYYSLQPWSSTITPKPEIVGKHHRGENSVPDIPDHAWTGSTVLSEADLECEEPERTPIIVNGSGILGYNLTSARTKGYATLWDPGMLDPNDTALVKHVDEVSPGGFKHTYHCAVNLFKPGPEYYNLALSVHRAGPYGASPLDAGVYVWASARLQDSLNTTSIRSSHLPSRWTAILCFPRYYESNVNATVLMPSGTVQGINSTSHRVRIPGTPNTTLSGFFDQFYMGQPYIEDIKDLHEHDPSYDDSNNYRVGLGAVPDLRPSCVSQVRKRFGGTIVDPRVISQHEGEASGEYLGMKTTSACQGFSYAYPDFGLHTITNDTLETLFDPRSLANMHRSAFKLHFALFCKEELLQRNGSLLSKTTITTDLTLWGFGVSKLWCRALQGAVAIVAMLTTFLMVFELGRPCKLDGEPNSLASALAILHRSTDLTEQLDGSEFRSITAMKNTIAKSASRYRLELELDVGPRVEVAEMVGSPSLSLRGSEFPTPQESEQQTDAWQTSVYSGVLLVVLFALMMAITIVLYTADSKYKGIKLPFTTNSFAYKILFAYVPTLLATVIETLLVSLGSHYSMFGPYLSLRRGHASSKNTLSIDYDKSPPHFQILRCVRSGDLTLGALTISILLSNVLAVAFSNIFSPNTGPSTVLIPVKDCGEPKLSSSNMSEMDVMMMQYTLDANLSATGASPNWTSKEYYVLPITPPTIPGLERITVPTIGLGADVHCSFVPTTDITPYCKVRDPTTMDSTFRDISHCWRSVNSHDPSPLNALLVAADPCWPILNQQGNYSAEYIGQPAPLVWSTPGGDGLLASPQCPGTFFAAWGEIPADPDNAPKSIDRDYLPETRFSILRCNITHKSVRLTVAIDPKGNVLDVKDVLSLQQMDGADYDAAKNLVSVFINASAESANVWAGSQGSTVGLGWYNSHLVSLYPEIVVKGRNITHIPKREVLPDAFQDVIRRLYAIGLRLSSQNFLQYEGTPKKTEAEAIVMIEKVVLSTKMVGLVLGILGYTTIVIVLLYWGPQGERRSSHAPTCLAAMWAHLYASDAKRLCGEIRGANIYTRLRMLDKVKGARFTYGRFRGKDGEVHEGVYMEDERAEAKHLIVEECSETESLVV
ncbi:hypothetical protein DFP73DRAFT_614012 [Morchella snyderi]|nr:hypothetical protein DFP73DRAFT_614012 [Morchella snyderi]